MDLRGWLKLYESASNHPITAWADPAGQVLVANQCPSAVAGPRGSSRRCLGHAVTQLIPPNPCPTSLCDRRERDATLLPSQGSGLAQPVVFTQEFLAEFRDAEAPLRTGLLRQLSNVVPEDLPGLLAAWYTTNDERRRHIVRRLVELSQVEADVNFDDVFRFCLDDADADVRSRAIGGLADCEDRWFMNRLMELLGSDPVPHVRAAAAQGLGRFVYLAELGELRPRDRSTVEDGLFASLDRPGQPLDVRRRVVEALGAFSDARVAELIGHAYADPEPLMRVSALCAMGRSCDPFWLPTILRELRSPRADMRHEAVLACREMADPAAVPSLVPLLEDDSVRLRIAVLGVLGALGGKVAERTIVGCLDHPDAATRRAAAQALHELRFSDDPLTADPD